MAVLLDLLLCFNLVCAVCLGSVEILDHEDELLATRQIQNFQGIHTNTTTRGEQSKQPYFDDTDDMNWFQPEVRPIGVSVRGDRDQVQVSFHVKHSVPARVVRFGGFTVDTELLDPHGLDGPSRSVANFTIDRSQYCDGNASDYFNLFVFENRDDSTGSRVKLKFDVCKYDRYLKEGFQWENRTWEAEGDAIHENVTTPKFRFESDVTAGFVVIPKRNESFDMTLEMHHRSRLAIHAIFFDRRTRKMAGDKYEANVHQMVYGYHKGENKKRQLLQVQMRTKKTVQNALEGNKRKKRSQIGLRVTLLTSSAKLTGQLHISVKSHYVPHLDRTLVNQVYVTHQFLFRKPGKMVVFPRRRIFMPKRQRFICGEDGNENHEKIGKKCTLSCWAVGRNLTDIYITKKESKVPIYQTRTHSHNDRISTIIDLGRATPEIEGDYECTAIGASFSRYQELELFILKPPEINRSPHITSVLDLGNGTSIVTCPVDGILPINVSIYTSLNNIRVDNQPYAQRHVEERENSVTLTIALPTDVLQYPSGHAYCKASSTRGTDSFPIYLKTNIEDILGPHRAHMMANDTAIVHFDNGTIAVTCSASGRQPLALQVTLGGTSEKFRIDNEPGNIWVEERMENGTTATMFTDSLIIQSHSQIYCVAKNDLNTDYFELSLKDLVDWTLIYH